MMKTNVLAIETSCDETAAAVVQNGRCILSNVIHSQIQIHKQYGGVVPEIASRKHIEKIAQVVQQALDDAKISQNSLTSVAVTYGPGLVGALLVGLSFAKSFAWALDLPLIGVHHISAHISANYLSHPNLKPPFMCLVVSGGHSHIIYVEDYGSYKLIGRTRDDAAGEAYDKVARILGLGYPGGPIIDRLSLEGDAERVNLPKVLLKDGQYDFSFSGLKTAVINYVHSIEQKGLNVERADVAAAFQNRVVEQLANKLIEACEDFNVTKLAIAGGVAANQGLRSRLEADSVQRGMQLFYPDTILCTDNAAMIGSDAFYRMQKGEIADLSLNAVPQLELGS